MEHKDETPSPAPEPETTPADAAVGQPTEAASTSSGSDFVDSYALDALRSGAILSSTWWLEKLVRRITREDDQP